MIRNTYRKIVANPAIALSCIIFLATILRLFQLDYESLWLDELYSVVPVNPSNDLDFIINYAKTDQPPFYFLLLHYWFKITTYTSFSARLLSAVIGILGVLVMYFLGKEFKNQFIGLTASFLTAINYFHIYYSQEVRFYGLLFLLSALSFLFFLRCYKRPIFLNFLFYILSSIALLYTQYFGLLIIFTHGIILCYFALILQKNRDFWLYGLVSIFLIMLAFSPWFSVIFYDLSISSYWIEQPKPWFIFVYIYIYWGKDFLTVIILSLLALLWIIKVFKNYKSIILLDKFLVLTLLTWTILTYSIPYIKSIISTPTLIPRYTLITLPALFIIYAHGINILKNHKAKVYIFALLLCASFINLFFIRYYNKIDKPQWREAAQIVIDKNPGDVKIYSNWEWWYNFYFYNSIPGLRVVGMYSSNPEAEIDYFINEVGNEEKFWVLGAEGNSGLNDLQQKFIDEKFHILEQHNFMNSSAILYGQ
ncbi:MAG: glycosyltransferase family 39 protein [Bacteroidota bacterium]|nr:glycosyltransferase family 39 protein [Bacteroidota bacterium]